MTSEWQHLEVLFGGGAHLDHFWCAVCPSQEARKVNVSHPLTLAHLLLMSPVTTWEK